MNLNIRKMIALFSLLAVLIPSLCLAFLEEDEEIIKSFASGVIRRIAVAPSQQVKRGDLLLIFEFMKMECSITAPRDGFIGALYFTVDQRIEEGESLVTILPFMPVEKGGDPMEVDEFPLPTAQDNEPSVKDLSQNDLGEVVSLPAFGIASEAKQSIPESQPSQQVMTPSWIAEDSMSPRTDEAEETEIASFSAVVMPIPVGQVISEVENEPQMSYQEVMLPLVAAPITEIPNNEGGFPDVSSPAYVTVNEEKPSIPEHQPPQQVLASSWIAVDFMNPRNISSSSQKIKIEEFQQGVNDPKPSSHLLWLTRLLLLAFLSFCRLRGIMPYRIKNILPPKVAENLNISGYLKDAA